MSTERQITPLSIVKEGQQGDIFMAECVVVPGHSIERVGENEWVPSRLIQEVDDRGWRTGKRNQNLGPDSENAIVGGGHAVVLAAEQCCSELSAVGQPPKLVIFSGGRPGYLNENAPDKPELCEATPMMGAFGQTPKETGVVALTESQTTLDDIRNSIQYALSHGLNRVAFILMDVRLERASALWEMMKSNDTNMGSLDVRFLPAEEFLTRHFRSHPAYENVLSAYQSSHALNRTRLDEARGAEAARNGTYQGTGNY